MPSFVKDRLVGSISLAIATVFTGVFFALYHLAGGGPIANSLRVMAAMSGKVSVCGDLIASAVAIAGMFFDRRKAIALLGIVVGLLSSGLVGTFVFNI